MDEDRERRLAEIVEYTRHDLRQRNPTGPGGEIHIHYHEAPAPVRPPELSVLDKYTPHLILFTGIAIIGVIVAVVFVMIAQALMIACLSIAITGIAVAAMVRSLRHSAMESKIVDHLIDRDE